jgi:hypothetical protein
MFTKSRKDKFVDQAQDLARDLTEAIAPHVERARDELAPHVERARDELGPRIADARDQIAPKLADARDQVAPKLAEARDEIAPRLAEARDQIAPHVEDARGRIVKGVASATAAATPVVAEARRRGVNASAALQGEPPVKRKGRKRKLFVFATLAGLGAYAFQKLRGGESSNWQTSYSPSTAPAAPPAPPSPSAPQAGSHAADVPVDAAEADAEPVGATPGESLSDATEEPHPVTTPDSPAEDVEVTQGKKPKKS